VWTRRLCLLAAIALATLVTTGTFAQEVPETPETPEATPAPEPTVSPEPTAEPEATAAPSLVFETTVDFEFVRKIMLEGQVGEVEIRGVEFTSGSGKGGIFGSSDADLKASITARLDCSTTADKKWKIDFTIQYLDGEGNPIDRAKGNASLKAEAKVVEVNHTTLKYVVPLIKKVRISAVGKGKS